MSARDHEYTHDVYVPRRCRRPEEAAETIRKHLAAVEAERDQLREHADRLAGAIEKGRPSYRIGAPEIGRGGWDVYFHGESWTDARRVAREYRETRT